MNFCEYYSEYIKTNGVPKLSLEQHQRLMNIVHYEGYLVQINKDLELFGNNAITASYYKEVKRKLETLFGAPHPATVVGDMIEKSL